MIYRPSLWYTDHPYGIPTIPMVYRPSLWYTDHPYGMPTIPMIYRPSLWYTDHPYDIPTTPMIYRQSWLVRPVFFFYFYPSVCQIEFWSQGTGTAAITTVHIDLLLVLILTRHGHLWTWHREECWGKFEWIRFLLRYVYTLRLIGPISYLDACYIRTKVTKCIREKMTMYFRGLTFKSHSSGYEIGPIDRSV